MAAAKKTNLMNEFLRDHQRMTFMLSNVVSHLERGDVALARLLAQKLDRLAGPHIEFEELTLYPAVQVALGESYERKLLAEHSNARAGLAQLLTATKNKLRKPEFRKKVVAALQSGLKHAEGCGTLVSHLEQFSEQQQEEALVQLNRLKRAGKCWTELAG